MGVASGSAAPFFKLGSPMSVNDQCVGCNRREIFVRKTGIILPLGASPNNANKMKCALMGDSETPRLDKSP